jgi:hypothetical protein
MQTRVIAVFTAVVVLAGVGLLNVLDAAGEQAKQGDPYLIEQQIERLQPALGELPPAANIGYISDMDMATTRGLLAFDAARYALAPRLLVHTAGAQPGDWVLGNFSSPQDFAETGAKAGLALYQDLGNGVVLYRKAAQ